VTTERKRVLVTGGASGIGAAIVERLLAGGDLVAVLDKNPGERAGAPVEVMAGDVTDPAAVDDCFDRLDRAWGGVDVVFNNAGLSVREAFLEASLEVWERTLAVNLTGVFLVAQRAARRMVAAGSGVIVNIGSVSARSACPGTRATT
jgi:meso-butanediol dehydrogenase/(S,S)-butanediol dehydrogenase/diacetyl reductase